MAARGVVPAYWAGMAGLWFGVVALPAFRPLFWTVAGLLSAGAIALGIT